MPSTVTDLRRVSDRSPWQVVIKEMGAGRGPGEVIATLCDAKAVGGSIFYNSAGEAHFTLPNDHPEIDLVQPRKVHYVIQQREGEPAGPWRDVFEGLVIDKDATDDETVFYGMDYLGLLQSVLDERFDTDHPDLPPPVGSKYVDETIGDVVADQLSRAISLVDSPVGFITVGTIEAMPEKVTIWSTMKNTLEFTVGLIDSHRQGTGKRTRLSVRKFGTDYRFIVEDNPGVQLPNMKLAYGELVQGYDVIPFGPEWANMVHGIGRTREGLKVLYDTKVAPGATAAEWGRFAKAQLFLDLADLNDLKRRTAQAAYDAGHIGQKVGLAYRVNALRPLDGYDVLDRVPIEIIHGGIDTRDYLPWWVILGVTWEATEDGSTDLILSIVPQTDVTAADPGLATSDPYEPGGTIVNPDGTTRPPAGFGDHVHAIGEPMIGDGATTVFYPANEFEPWTLEAFVDGIRTDITEGTTYDYITFAPAPGSGAAIRLNYLAVLVP